MISYFFSNTFANVCQDNSKSKVGQGVIEIMTFTLCAHPHTSALTRLHAERELS